MQSESVLQPLIGLSLEELISVALSEKMPKFTGKQLADWLYKKMVTEFSEMVNISKKNQEKLSLDYKVGRFKPVSSMKSEDGTVKFLYKTPRGEAYESVYIPDKDRGTLCVSSQVGCKMNCYFCATGRIGFKSNLTAAMIINQILNAASTFINRETGLSELTNVVFMGMGEPLDNFKEVQKVLDILTADWGFAWSPKRITVSTVGKLPQLKELLDNTQVHVAVSLHTANISEREQLMPAQKAFPIASVVRLLKGYDFSHQRRLSFEYIMWKGVNDDIAHAEALVKLIHGLESRVNLIKFHSIPGVDLKPASEERMLMFRNYLNSKGIICTIRASRGEDIMAACGMLAGNCK